MRQFKLWNALRTEAFDFTNQGCIITDVAGLGVGFQATFANETVVDYAKTFEDISLTVNFGVNANAYTKFTELAAFISANGRNNLVLEYAFNDKTVYADVWLKALPKTQKTNFGVITEKVLFSRVTYWYTIQQGTLPVHPATVTIQNQVMDDILVGLTITGPTSGTLRIALLKGGQVDAEIRLVGALISGETITIDSEKKSVTITAGGISANGYNLISRAHDTFVAVPFGTYGLCVYSGTTGGVSFSYKKWVLD